MEPELEPGAIKVVRARRAYPRYLTKYINCAERSNELGYVPQQVLSGGKKLPFTASLPGILVASGICVRVTEMPNETCRASQWTFGMLIAFALTMVSAASVGMTEDFGSVRYDSKSDQLIVTVLYDGTNANHHFSIQWGPCRQRIDQPHQAPRNIIEVDILDDQGNDAATKSFTETIRVPLTGLSCRPATVTLWAQPNSTIDIDIP